KNRGLSRAQLQVVIEDLAAARRAPGHSRKQGHDDFVTKNVVGMELHRIFVTTAPLHLSSATPRPPAGQSLHRTLSSDFHRTAAVLPVDVQRPSRRGMPQERGTVVLNVRWKLDAQWVLDLRRLEQR